MNKVIKTNKIATLLISVGLMLWTMVVKQPELCAVSIFFVLCSIIIQE